MALKPCAECGEEISTSARACPKCGAKVPRTKWWLWGPLIVVGLALAYGASIPENERRAMELRRLCEQMATLDQRQAGECDRIYSDALNQRQP